MADWEDAPAPVLKKLDKPWDDEDADEDDVLDSWEDIDKKLEPEPVAPPPEKAPKKSAAKSNDKKGKSVEVAPAVALDPIAEKLRQQRLVEEADYKHTTELFAKKGDEKSLENFIPKSESDFVEYAELIAQKLKPYEKSFHYTGLLKAVMRLSISNLKAAEAKEVASSVTAIANEKLKTEKEANAGKKKSGAKKKQLILDKADDDAVISAYDVGDEYDFM
jgi:translation initiation factor 3 subunit J